MITVTYSLVNKKRNAMEKKRNMKQAHRVRCFLNRDFLCFMFHSKHFLDFKCCRFITVLVWTKA